MHFLILGGNGRTGAIVVDDALSRNHKVTALVRDPSKIQARAGLDLVKGTPTNIDDMRKAFKNQKIDAVLVTLNAPRASDNPFAKSIAPPRLMADSVKNATTVMREQGVSRIIVMQAFGVGSSFDSLNFLMRMTISMSEMSKQFADHNMVAQELAEADGLSWTMVRPAMLKGEEALPVQVLGDDGKGGSFMPKCSRQSVARFIIEECAEKQGYQGRTPVICN